MCNWLLCFGCASEELRVIVARLADWVANSSPPWATYRTLMACRLVALNKQPGVRPVGIGETLRRALAKLFMRAAGDQVKTTCGNIQLCAGLDAGIEGATHAVGQRRLGMVRRRRSKEEEADDLAGEEELEWQYLQRTVPGVGTLMGPIEEALREKFFPALLWGGEINAHFSDNPRPYRQAWRLGYTGPLVVSGDCLQHLQGG